MEKLFKKIASLVEEERHQQEEVGNLHLDMSYMTEEVGELAKDLVDGDYKHAKSEAADVVVTAFSMFRRLGGDYAELEALMKKAIKKWERKL